MKDSLGQFSKRRSRLNIVLSTDNQNIIDYCVGEAIRRRARGVLQNCTYVYHGRATSRIKLEKFDTKNFRRKIWEEEQLRKKMENEIFGNFEKSEENDADSKLNENESNSSVVEEIKSKKENSSFLKYFIVFVLILVAYFLFNSHSD